MDVQRFFYPSDSSPKVESWLAHADPSLQPVDMVVSSAGTVLAVGSPTPQTLPPMAYAHLPSAAASDGGGGGWHDQQGAEGWGAPALPAAMRMSRAMTGGCAGDHRAAAPSAAAAAAAAASPVVHAGGGIAQHGFPGAAAAAAAVGLPMPTAVRFACNVCGLDGWLHVDPRHTEIRFCPACGMIQRWR